MSVVGSELVIISANTAIILLGIKIVTHLTFGNTLTLDTGISRDGKCPGHVGLVAHTAGIIGWVVGMIINQIPQGTTGRYTMSMNIQ
jgi:hypothetical protein